MIKYNIIILQYNNKVKVDFTLDQATKAQR